MCGITGFWQRPGSDEQALHATVRRMADSLITRGPDDSGSWTEASAGIALGHRRLSIVDLSVEGHQPMASACGRYVIVFNGEIYNHRELRQRIEVEAADVHWRGQSDTEVLVEAIRRWGLDQALAAAVGMFAFALWDREARSLTLCRDRLGEKPLYYGWQGDALLFGSELKALRRHPAFQGEIDRNALALLLRHNYVPAPYSIYRGITKVMPGTYLVFQAGRREARQMVYWSARAAAENGQRELFAGSDAEAIEELERLLHQSIAGQRLADVPLGAFLSGGIDSSTVVAIMQAQAERPVQTFSIGFNEDAYNEAQDAKRVAIHLGTDHTELYVSPEDAMAIIPQLPAIYDEPFADSSQVPTCLVSRLARQHVTVSLSGDGGDELFCGYNRYFWGISLWNKMRWMPAGARQLLAGVITGLSPGGWEKLFHTFDPVLPRKLKARHPGDKLHKMAEIIGLNSPEAMYLALVSHWKSPASVVIGATEPRTLLNSEGARAQLPDFVQQMMYLDTATYLPDDILAKVDRASMAVSLESRVPLLDHRVLEFAWRLPLHMKLRNGQGKWLLRQVLYRHVPHELVERPKMGFAVPIDHWLRGPLRDWAESLINEERLRREGFFNPGPIRQKWNEHLSGQRNQQYYLWSVLMFQAWMEAGSN